MRDTIKVLVVEDQPSDAALNVRALESDGFQVSYEVVATEADMKVALGRQAFDLTLGDHSMPRFDSLKALAVIRKIGLDIPFIVVSGAIGEETAIALMKAGANDYVMKDNLSRLGPAVRRELADAEIRRSHASAERALRESEERYRALVESMDDAVLLVDDRLTIHFANAKYLARHGLSPAAVPGLNYREIHSEAGVVEFARRIRGTIASGRPAAYEYVSASDGRVFLRTLSPLREAVPNGVAKVLVISRDISDIKTVEDKLRSLLAATVDVISATVEKRDPYTAGHQKRVAKLAAAVAEEMGLPAASVETIYTAGVLHDLGKIAVPVEILNKPSALSEIERKLIRAHSFEGYEILKDVEFPGPVARIVLEHHERLDGSGYPAGLKGEASLIESRVLVVADVVEAMASHRPFRPALGLDRALDEILKNGGVLYESRAVDSCLRLFKDKRFDWGDVSLGGSSAGSG
jgi:PAS domain S-box-containing protein/putative nucleotidyltransferase with HDIG domain